MSSTVLLPVNNYAPWARDVATVVTEIEDDDVEVVVLHVFDDNEVASTHANLNDPETLSLDELAMRKNGVDAAQDVLSADGLEATPCGVREDEQTADAIIEMAESVGADRVYLYGRKRSPAGKAVFGSTIQRVILNATVPVTIVPAAAV